MTSWTLHAAPAVMERRCSLTIVCGLLVILLMTGGPDAVRAEIRYDVIELGTLNPFGFSQATGINATGQVIGITDMQALRHQLARAACSTTP